MVVPDFVPEWMSNPPHVPPCPSWCLEAAGHHNPGRVPGSWTRFHVAFRESFFTARGDVMVEVASHQSWMNNTLRGKQAQLYIIGGTGLAPVHQQHLQQVLRRAQAVLTTINNPPTPRPLPGST